MLLASDNKTADANGKAVCVVQPLRAFEDWHITNTAVQSTSAAVPTVKVYKGGESPTNFIEGSYTAQFNASNTEIDLLNGERLLVVFEGATAGSSCSVSVTGEARGR